MPHSSVFSAVSRAMRVGEFAHDRTLSAREALEHAARSDAAGLSRRRFLLATSMAAGAAAVGAWPRAASGTPPWGNPRIAIVGGGLAGLCAADALAGRGLSATIYEAADRVGGRCWSLRGFFPGQVAERGGEFIDTTHQTMRHYAVRFGLAREDVRHEAGDVLYHFGGTTYSDAQIVEEYRRLVPRLRADLRTLSNEPTFFRHTPADAALDAVSLAEYLATRAGDLPLVRAALDEAYVAEYGLEAAEQSCLNLLLFIHADRRRRFKPFGVFSDERFHLVGGNDAIASGIAAGLPGPILTGRRLVRLARAADGAYVLEFDDGPSATADFVVMTLPFSVLRTLDLDPSLGLSADKRRAIDDLGYGNNAKTMVNFHGRPWSVVGGSGAMYSDLPEVQTTWETNASAAGATSVLTDYAGGTRGQAIGAQPLQDQVAAFLGDLNEIVPGANVAAVRDGGGAVRAFREHWPSNPLSRGAYTCYTPGQFTSIAGLEGQPAGRLKFAGEHADSFYSWQGFMEGACLSGIRAAGEIITDLRRR
ncbi:MAG: putative L-amino-acid oxidase YobN [Phycisphaerae bacterium]|nr:MAG: putative L-amino-acid oxidase YobN [Phycisphaerae bacterium]